MEIIHFVFSLIVSSHHHHIFVCLLISSCLLTHRYAVCLLIGSCLLAHRYAVCLLISSCLSILFIYKVSDWCSRVWVLSFLCSLNLLVLPTDLFVLALLLLAVCIVLACSLHCLHLHDVLLLLAKCFANIYKMCCLCKQNGLSMWAKRFAYVVKKLFFMLARWKYHYLQSESIVIAGQ